VKSLESLVLSYDLTVRDNGGGIVQFLYGEDGIDVGKSTCLKQKQFDFLLDNFQVGNFIPYFKTLVSIKHLYIYSKILKPRHRQQTLVKL